MKRPKLEIQTDFYEDEEPDNFDHFLSDQGYYEPKTEAANRFEEILSSMMTVRFIDCWEELKIFYYTQREK